ncbi:MAG TPA: antitoxin [Candidatus Faecousia faecigallinarum]|nr:antitoxin [Candidatus Faecousia faecigallinarum]
MAYSEVQKEATARYNKKAYDRISIVVPKGKRQVIADFAKRQGKSVNRFINDAIDIQMAESQQK